MFKSIKEKYSKFCKYIGGIFVGVISILGIFFFIKKRTEISEKKSMEKIKDLENNNEIIDVKIDSNDRVIGILDERKSELLDELENKKNDESKNLQDFFDKRGFWCIILLLT